MGLLDLTILALKFAENPGKLLYPYPLFRTARWRVFSANFARIVTGAVASNLYKHSVI